MFIVHPRKYMHTYAFTRKRLPEFFNSVCICVEIIRRAVVIYRVQKEKKKSRFWGKNHRVHVISRFRLKQSNERIKERHCGTGTFFIGITPSPVCTTSGKNTAKAS